MKSETSLWLGKGNGLPYWMFEIIADARRARTTTTPLQVRKRTTLFAEGVDPQSGRLLVVNFDKRLRNV